MPSALLPPSCPSLQVADDSNGSELSIFDPRAQSWVQWMGATHGANAAQQMLEKAAMEEAAAALSMSRNRGMEEGLPGSPHDPLRHNPDGSLRAGGSPPGLRDQSPDVTLSKPYNQPGSPMTPDVRLWHRCAALGVGREVGAMVKQSLGGRGKADRGPARRAWALAQVRWGDGGCGGAGRRMRTARWGVQRRGVHGWAAELCGAPVGRGQSCEECRRAGACTRTTPSRGQEHCLLAACASPRRRVRVRTHLPVPAGPWWCTRRTTCAAWCGS